MKKTKLIAALGAVLLAAIVVGCTTTKRKSRALVCPECKDVSMLVYPHQDVVEGFSQYQIEHQCKGCRGAVENFFRDGSFTHACSICRNQPWSCDLKHRD